MSSWTIQRSFNDISHDQGLWSPSTSLANFCEEDYQVSWYVAEFVNTLSNLAYVYYAGRACVVGVDVVGRRGFAAATTRGAAGGWGWEWDMHGVSLLAVGLASASFHMSLRMWPQWLDQTSMYLLAASFSHALITTSYVPRRGAQRPGPTASKSTSTPTIDDDDASNEGRIIVRTNQVETALALFAVLAFPTALTVVSKQLAIHSVTFALLLLVSGLKMIKLISQFNSLDPRRFVPTETLMGVRVSAAQRTLVISLARAFAFLNLAFALWLLDCTPEVCFWLRRVRNNTLGSVWWLRPLGFLTELHGWWHILTARAAGEYIALLRILTTPD